MPDVFAQIAIEKYVPVFSRPSTTVDLRKSQSRPKLIMVGEESYANVYS